MPTGRTIEPVATVLALGIGETLFLFTLRTHAVHLAVGDVLFKDQAALGTDFGIATEVAGFTARCRANEHRVTRVTPVLATRHFLTNRTLFNQGTSTETISAQEQTMAITAGGLNYHQDKHAARALFANSACRAGSRP